MGKPFLIWSGLLGPYRRKSGGKAYQKINCPWPYKKIKYQCCINSLNPNLSWTCIMRLSYTYITIYVTYITTSLHGLWYTNNLNLIILSNHIFCPIIGKPTHGDFSHMRHVTGNRGLLLSPKKKLWLVTAEYEPTVDWGRVGVRSS